MQKHNKPHKTYSLILPIKETDKLKELLKSGKLDDKKRTFSGKYPHTTLSIMV